MLEQIKRAFSQAHATITYNPVVVWFPALFNTALFVLFMLASVVFLMPIVPDLFTNPEVIVANPELLSSVFGRLLMLFALGALLSVAANAGAVALQAQAVKGEKVDTADFINGARRLFVRVLTGNIVVWLVYTIVFLGTMGLFAGRIARTLISRGLDTVPSPEVMVEILASSLPLLLIGFALFAIASIFFSMWARFLALVEGSVWRALRSSMTFAWQNFFALSLLVIGQFLLTALSQPLVERLPQGGLVFIVLSYVIRVYLSLTLMHFYMESSSA